MQDKLTEAGIDADMAAALARSVAATADEISALMKAAVPAVRGGGVQNSPRGRNAKLQGVVVVWLGRLSKEKEGLSAGSWQLNQETMRDTWRKANPDSSLLASFFDDGVCGADISNLVGRKSVEALAESQSFNVLLCEAVDRIGRDFLDLVRFADKLRRLGIKIVTIRHGEMNDLLFAILAIIAQEERKACSARVRNSRPIHIAKGRVLGIHPYGFDVDESDRLVENPYEASVVRLGYHLYGRTFIGVDQICRIFEELGIPSPRGGTDWSTPTMIGVRVEYEDGIQHPNGIFSRSAYVGERVTNLIRSDRDDDGKIRNQYTQKKDWRLTPCPAIVDRETFDLVQRRLKSLAVGGGVFSYLLSGLMYCGVCDGKMVINSGGAKKASPFGVTSRVRCRASLAGDCCHCDSYDIEDVQAAMLALLRASILDDRLIAAFEQGWTSAQLEPLGDADKIAKEVASLEGIVGRLVMAQATKPDISHVFDKQIDDLRRRLFERRNAVAALNNSRNVVKVPSKEEAHVLLTRFLRELPRNLVGITDVDLVEALQGLRRLFARVILAPTEGYSRFRFRLDSVMGSVSGEVFAKHQRLKDDASSTIAKLEGACGPLKARADLNTLVLLERCGVIVAGPSGYRIVSELPSPLKHVFRCEVDFDGVEGTAYLGFPVAVRDGGGRGTQNAEAVLARFDKPLRD